MDGMGPGVYGSLDQIFRVFGEVWLSVQVGTETLDPRVRIVASPYALNASALEGRSSGSFLDVSPDAQTKSGPLTLSVTYPNAPAITAQGTQWGGFFQDIDDSGYAYVGYGGNGILAYGSWLGGSFQDLDDGGTAYCGYGASGIQAIGAYTGGYFQDTDNSGYAYVGYGDLGIEARGNGAGGFFQDSDQSGGAYIGDGDVGIYAYGNSIGGYFLNTSYTSNVYVAVGSVGIDAHGSDAGGTFSGNSGMTWTDVAPAGYKIYGTGTVSFVQNHPEEKDKVIVYAAPEGDEVAVYTRGTARLVDGEARVALGATFRWVTNPDIGLTAHLTPVGTWSDLYVGRRAPKCSSYASRGGATDAVFDYIVYGLRIGFEESSIVQHKESESFIPSMEDHRELYVAEPELRAYNALERFRAMGAGAGLGRGHGGGRRSQGRDPRVRRGVRPPG